MARLTVFPNGLTASFPRYGSPPEVAVRGVVNGWSRQATQRLKRWLMSVDGEQLEGVGFAFTLTIRDLPPSADDWSRSRRAFVERLRRLGFSRLQWLTEWQRRGVPHLHGVVFFPVGSAVNPAQVVEHWLQVAAPYLPRAESQAVKPLHGLTGWLQYQAKHSVRGVEHYQRGQVPKSWQKGTGRLWGHLGAWPLTEQVIEIGNATFHRFRRLVRSYLVGSAREDLQKAVTPKQRRSAARRLAYLPGMLTDSNLRRSRVRAVGEWCPAHVALQLLAVAERRHQAPEYVDTATGEVLTGFAAWERSRRGAVLLLEGS